MKANDSTGEANATKSKRRSRQQKLQRSVAYVPVDALGMATSRLDELVAKRLTLQSAVSQLYEKLRSSIEQGVGYDELAETLTASGIQITVTRLKQLMAAEAKARGLSRRRRRPSLATQIEAVKALTEAKPEAEPEKASKRSTRPAKEESTTKASTPGRRGRKPKSASASSSSSQNGSDMNGNGASVSNDASTASSEPATASEAADLSEAPAKRPRKNAAKTAKTAAATSSKSADKAPKTRGRTAAASRRQTSTRRSKKDS